MRNGLIEAVGPSVKVPAGARVIDAKGLVLTPGLIDGFSGLGLPSAAPRGPGGGWPGGRGQRRTRWRPQSLALDRLKAADALEGPRHGSDDRPRGAARGRAAGPERADQPFGRQARGHGPAPARRPPSPPHRAVAPLPERSHGHGRPRPPGPLRRPSLRRGLGGLREGPRREEAAAVRRRARRLAGRGGGTGDPGRHRLRAPTTSAAPWPWPTSSRSRSRWRERPRPRASRAS